MLISDTEELGQLVDLANTKKAVMSNDNPAPSTNAVQASASVLTPKSKRSRAGNFTREETAIAKRLCVQYDADRTPEKFRTKECDKGKQKQVRSSAILASFFLEYENLLFYLHTSDKLSEKLNRQ